MVIGGDYRRLHPTLILLTCTLHGNSSQNQPDPRGDRQAESWEADAFLKQEVRPQREGLPGSPAQLMVRLVTVVFGWLR